MALLVRTRHHAYPAGLNNLHRENVGYFPRGLIRTSEKLMSSDYEISVQVDERYAAEIEPAALVEAVRATLHQQEVASATLTLVVTDDEDVRQLNHTYRGLDEPTDVLSFAEQDTYLSPDAEGTAQSPRLVLPPELIAEQALYLGDIIIAYPYTKRQAECNGRRLLAELRLLAIHGTLHLLGYDHATPTTEAEMWAIQNSILVMLGEDPIKLL